MTLLALIFLVGCRDGVSPDLSHVGTFHLTTINGRNLPGRVREIGSETVDITGGSIMLASNNTFSNEIAFRFGDGAEVRTEVERITGTYSRAAETIQLTTSEGFSFTLYFDGTTILQTVDQFILAYTR